MESAFRPDSLYSRSVFLTTRDNIYIRDSNVALFLKECYNNDSFVLLTIPKTSPTFEVRVLDNSDYDSNEYAYHIIDNETGEIYFSIYSQNKFNQIIKTKKRQK